MKASLAAILLCAILAASPGAAQLALPGASSPDAPSGEKPRPPKKTQKAAAPIAAAGVAAVVGRTLLLNGATGQLEFSGRVEALQIDHFTMVGEVISDSKQQCRIDVGAGAPIAAKSLGRPDGLLRYSADIPACPFEFDVLDGAVLAPPQVQACVFKDADCQANPSGLWGPAAASLPTDAKQTTRARAQAEAAMAANYRALTARLNDPGKADSLAQDQARFSSDRDETCRAYARENVHNFCAIRLTEARAAFLKARFDETPVEAPGKGKSQTPRKHKAKPKPEPEPAQ